MNHFFLSHIVAASSNNVIGFQNKIPWDIPEDLRFFRKKTSHHTCIMGRKTFESLGQPLPHRLNIVISKNKNFQAKNGVVIVPTIDKAIETARKNSKKSEIFIIGGGEIYRQTLHLVQKIYITRIYQNVQGDSFYPDIPEDIFELVAKDPRPGRPRFSFLTYEKRNPS